MSNLRVDPALLRELERRGARIGRTVAEQLAEIEGPAIEPPEGLKPKAAERCPVRKIKTPVERRFALLLDELRTMGKILRWRYEGERFQLADYDQSQRTYTPDFCLWFPCGRRAYFETKGRRPRDSDNETRAMLLWIRQQFADENHEFRAFRELEGGGFREIWPDMARPENFSADLDAFLATC